VGDLTGILNVNKPLGWTSHDVVARIRRLAGQKRVGHAGTLDPQAAGVLPVLLGRATRLADFIQSGTKTYIAAIKLGEATETDDSEGTVSSVAPVPRLTDAVIHDALGQFRGEIFQTPPKYSALKVAGSRAYALARAGADVALAPRPVAIHDLALRDWTPDELTLEITCSKGTYVRALARDIAAALGTVGHLKALTRTRVGSFIIDDALTVEEIADRGVPNSLLPPDRAIADAPTFSADADEAARLRNGQPIAAQNLRSDSVWVYDPLGQPVCLASAVDGLLRPRIVL
jgi:tRNA pseudouridine55 synthase